MLLPYTPIFLIDPSYRWGSAKGSTFCLKVERCYDEVVHWWINVFSIPSGKAGKDFVSEMARLYKAYAEGSQIESLTLTAAMILRSLILQKPYPGSKAKEHVKCHRKTYDPVARRGHASIRNVLPSTTTEGTPRDNLARSFANFKWTHHEWRGMMECGKCWWSQEQGGGISSVCSEGQPGGLWS